MSFWPSVRFDAWPPPSLLWREKVPRYKSGRGVQDGDVKAEDLAAGVAHRAHPVDLRLQHRGDLLGVPTGYRRRGTEGYFGACSHGSRMS